ncbi:MAG: hypothetical protein Q8L42_14130, partial [Sulfurimicrobium sp.]|nr:hypothetical protein [Sulfurimicrobium sp.]
MSKLGAWQFYVTNKAQMNGGLEVVGNTTLQSVDAGMINASGLSSSGDAHVSGISYLNAIQSGGIINSGDMVTDTLSTTGNATVGGDLEVKGAFKAEKFSAQEANFEAAAVKDLTVSGAAKFNTLSTTGNATVGGDLEVKGVLKVDKVEFDGGLKSDSANASLVNNTGHGIEITSTATKLTGGTSSTSLTLNDAGATFANSTTGAPATITGIADGKSDFDAVNFRQLQAVGDGIESRVESFVIQQLEESKLELSAGIAATAAMANIP